MFHKRPSAQITLALLLSGCAPESLQLISPDSTEMTEYFAPGDTVELSALADVGACEDVIVQWNAPEEQVVESHSQYQEDTVLAAFLSLATTAEMNGQGVTCVWMSEDCDMSVSVEWTLVDETL